MGCSLSLKISPDQLVAAHKLPRQSSHATQLTVRRSRFVSDASTSPMTPAHYRGRGGRKSIIREISTGTKCAIVVGINQYDHWDDLECPEGDASAVSAWLQSRQFQVTLLRGIEATFTSVMQALSAMDHTCETAVLSLHGHGVSGRNGVSFLPCNANPNPEDLSDKITVNFLKMWSQLWGGQYLLVVADCCFGGDFVVPPRLKMRGKGGKERVRMCLSGSTMGELIPDRSEKSASHSDLTHALLKTAKRRQWDGSVMDLFVHIRKIATNVKIGRLPGDEGGDMYI